MRRSLNKQRKDKAARSRDRIVRSDVAQLQWIRSEGARVTDTPPVTISNTNVLGSIEEAARSNHKHRVVWA